MKVIVITGSTRGLGYGLAQELLERGCAVSICGRSADSVNSAAETLARLYGRDRVLGSVCDVCDDRQIQELWNSSRQVFSKIDIWVNNAGISNPVAKVWEQSEGLMSDLIHTNVLGTLYGSKTAVNGMLLQGFGAVYNMLGMGSNGRTQDGLALYGTSKAALRYFTRSLAEEVKGTPIIVGALSPGMVLTDLLSGSRKTSPESWEQVKRVLNLFGERPETVTPWLAKQILENKRNGVEIRWLTTARLLSRMLVYPFNRYRVIK